MKKSSSTPPTVENKPEVGHLEVTLTRVASKTAARIEKWWKPIVAVLGALFVSYLIVQGVAAWKEQKEAALNERLFRIFHSPAARKEGYKVDPAELSRLLADTRGGSLEPLAYQAAGDFYLDKIEKLEEKVKAAADESPLTGLDSLTSPPKTPEPAKQSPTELAQELEAARSQALQVAAEAAQKLPANSQIVDWAAKVKAKIEGEKKPDWLPPKWKFSPPPPRDTEVAPAVK